MKQWVTISKIFDNRCYPILCSRDVCLCVFVISLSDTAYIEGYIPKLVFTVITPLSSKLNISLIIVHTLKILRHTPIPCRLYDTLTLPTVEVDHYDVQGLKYTTRYHDHSHVRTVYMSCS